MDDIQDCGICRIASVVYKLFDKKASGGVVTRANNYQKNYTTHLLENLKILLIY